MAKWAGWIAALGGLLAIVAQWVPGEWLLWVGGLVAIVFGLWGAFAKK